METFNVSTGQRNEFTEITGKVSNIVRDSDVQNGICVVFTPHTTAGITINENADPSVQHDLKLKLNEVFDDDPRFRHMEGNSDSHLKSSTVGCSEQIIIDGGRLVLGTWQGIYFCEFDGPRTRKVHVQILSQ
ncbi:MAG: secondary thiamine-phosphate synthase enzyme YjbQ [Candidatus Marinimicrobia bacterium]|nr:secondary thiamine-phosphate synthase enzyme YjbQ [Candidatus Neomarinimicrobiota bacterium]MCF7830140.1 secondary thiamine-phosphate synthase enzyme YjbQ [Candidatus Neomarinimicrobiota bacterium]MCF7882217.1 secondary thiamine-phosphate synthase enzyme YjbQ [Candidatus Neomarinimicrobiota bacterium]